MENQHNKNDDAALCALRVEIDKIDDQIISLLEQRMQVVDRVANLKKASGEKFFIRSSREADMIKDLIKKANPIIPKSTIVSIWRKIITTANMHEQNLKIALHNPKNIPDFTYLVREYYNDNIAIINHDSVTNIVSEMEKGQAQIGVFALETAQSHEDKTNISENWWINLANNKLGLRVFAKIPFVEFIDEQESVKDKTSLVAVAIKKAEKSLEDNSLLYVEASDEVSKTQILAVFREQNIAVRILKSVKLPQVDGVTFHLIEAAGFFEESDEVIGRLSKAKVRLYVKVLGSYALPIRV